MNIYKVNFDKFSEYIDILKKLAIKSPMTHKHAACLLQTDKVYTLGINKRLRSKFPSGEVALISIHAEVDCLANSSQKVCKGMDLLVIRVGKSDKLQNSRPCNSCISKLQKRGIRKVYYSTSDGEIVYEYVNNMPNLHTCSGIRFRTEGGSEE